MTSGELHLSVAVTLLIAGLSGWHSTPTVSDAFAEESNRLMRLTIPNGAWLNNRGSAIATSDSATQEWQVSTTADWNEYSRTVSQTLSSTYRCITARNSTMTCSRSLPGDSFQLELTADFAISGLIVSVRFEARPD